MLFGPGIYVHVPFCRSRCGYCDFFTAVGSAEARADFVALLESEIDLTADAGLFEGAVFRTVFLGGGTPSLLSGEEMRRVLDRVRRRFRLAAEIEITVESNPESITPAKLAAYRDAGVNRISLGVQSLDDEELRLLDRPHDAHTVARRVREIRAAGFDALSLDLIYGLPGSPAAAWERTLEGALALEPDHLSAYLLTLEPHVPLARRLPATALPGAEEVRGRYESLRERTARAGLAQYEISNFARPGRESLHNQNYWVRGDYLGLGPSAHAHRGGRRWENPASMPGWRGPIREGRLPRGPEEAVEGTAAASEWLFLGLRRMAGVRIATLRDAAGPERWGALEARIGRLAEAGLVAVGGGQGGIPAGAAGGETGVGTAGRNGVGTGGETAGETGGATGASDDRRVLRLLPEAYFVSNAVFVELMEAL